MSNVQVISPATAVDPDDEVLQYALEKRKQIVEKLMEKDVPADSPELMNIILKTLDGMDRAALGKKRIKADENIAGANQAMAATVIAGLLQKAGSPGVRPFESDTAAYREAPVLGNEIPPPQLVEGEVDVAAPQLSFDVFQKKFAPLDETSS